MKTRDLRELLVSLFSEFNAYYGDNTGELKDDYKINYQLPNFDLTEGQRTFRLEIDIWSKDDIKVDDIVEKVEELLNYNSYKKDKWATFILETSYTADEENIYRKTLTYEVRTYEGE